MSDKHLNVNFKVFIENDAGPLNVEGVTVVNITMDNYFTLYEIVQEIRTTGLTIRSSQEQ